MDNTNTTSVPALVGIVVVVALLLGGIFWYIQSNPSPTANNTTTGSSTSTTTGDGTQTGQTPQQPQAPLAVTNTETGVSATTMILTGSATPNGAFTNYWYEYGTSNSLGSKSATQMLGSGYLAIAAPAYITGLTRDTTYFYRLVAQNEFGTATGATYSTKTTHDTPAPVGGAPSAQTSAASSITRTSADINGQVSPNKNSTVYWFEYGSTASLGQISPILSAGNGSVASRVSAPLSNLAPASTYYFRLNAQNSFGTVNGSILSFKTIGPAISAAPIVVTLVTIPATTTAVLRGTVNPNDVQTTYWFEYGTNSGFGAGTQNTSHKTLDAGANTLSVETQVTGLRANTTYYYRMVAQNAGGISRGDRQTFKTK